MGGTLVTRVTDQEISKILKRSRYFTRKELGDLLRLSETTTVRKRSVIPCRIIRGLYRYEESELVDWIYQNYFQNGVKATPSEAVRRDKDQLPLMTYEGAAEYFGVSTRTVHRMVDEDGLPVFLVFGGRRFNLPVLRDYANRYEVDKS